MPRTSFGLYWVLFITVVAVSAYVSLQAQVSESAKDLAGDTFAGGIIGLLVLAYETWKARNRISSQHRVKLKDDLARVTALELAPAVRLLLFELQDGGLGQDAVRQYLLPVQRSLIEARFLSDRLGENPISPIIRPLGRQVAELTSLLLHVERSRISPPDSDAFRSVLADMLASRAVMLRALDDHVTRLERTSASLLDAELML